MVTSKEVVWPSISFAVGKRKVVQLLVSKIPLCYLLPQAFDLAMDKDALVNDY